MSIQVAQKAPEFKTQALVGKEFKTISLSDYAGRWVLLMFYPMDFTFVCPTELVGLNDKHQDFADRDCVVLAASTDTVFSHLGWTRADARLANLKYPILADVTKSISRDYGVLLEDKGFALRGTFLIDPAGVLRWASIHDTTAGRSIDEMVRVLDALQTGELCPVNWKKGDATLS
ncbi:MAG TPA: peroxiredoxin [Pseudomonadota bacterium]|nr:peroxiredoxin [Pseudomonadota bacterium]